MMAMSQPPPTEAENRRRALSRWDNEGGALAQSAPDVVAASRELTNTELVHLRIRIIALENLMIAVLAEGSEQQREMARDMAALITPRPGYAQHPLTVHAADHITDLIARADRSRMNLHSRACAYPPHEQPCGHTQTTAAPREIDMQNPTIGRQIIRWGWTLSVFILLSFLVCIAFGLLMPARFHMHEAWAPLLPGFEWLTWPGFIAGAVGSFLYGWYIAVLIVPIYRFFGGRETS